MTARRFPYKVENTNRQTVFALSLDDAPVLLGELEPTSRDRDD